MHRFFVPSDQCAGESIVLDDREAHHATGVLRLRVGEEVMVLDGVGHQLCCLVLRVARRSVELEVKERKFIPRFPYDVTLLQAIPKGKTFDTIVQKATELGAFRIIPLITERVVSQLDEESVEHKLEKWRSVSIESIKQCGSAWLPDFHAPVRLEHYLQTKHAWDLSVVASLQPQATLMRVIFDQYRAEHHKAPTSVAVWIGPEGDFTPAEYRLIEEAGGIPITLGPLVLRADTAAIVCLALANHELQQS